MEAENKMKNYPLAIDKILAKEWLDFAEQGKPMDDCFPFIKQPSFNVFLLARMANNIYFVRNAYERLSPPYHSAHHFYTVTFL
jgi:hypothetical protein